MTKLVLFPQYNDAEGNPADVAIAAADGTSIYMARRDHVHANSAAVIALFEPAGAVATHVAAGDPHTQYALLAGRAGGQTLIGGTGTTDDLILQTTSGIGATGADMKFRVGNNGSITALKILNSGFVGIGEDAIDPTAKVQMSVINAGEYLRIYGGGVATEPAYNANTKLVMHRPSITNGQIYLSMIYGPTAVRGGIQFGDDTDEDAGGILYRHDTDLLFFRTNASDRAAIDSLGRFGAGGIIVPTSVLDVQENSGAVLTLRRNDTSVSANDMIGKIQFYANDTSTITNQIVANIEAQAVDTISTDINPGRLIFRTTPVTVAGTPIERLRIDENGYVSIGAPTTPSALLDLAASTTARASLRVRSGVAPTSPNEGDIWFDGADIKAFIGGVTKTFTLV